MSPPSIGLAVRIASSDSAAAAGVFANQVLFLITGLFTTLATQWLFYMNAADSASMLTVLTTYIGMVAIALVPSRMVEHHRKHEDDHIPIAGISHGQKRTWWDEWGNVPHSSMFVIAVIDVFGNLVLTVGLFYVGSGLYQVIYSSVIVFTALMARVFLKRNLTIGQWIAVITITFGLSLNALGGGSSKSQTGDIHSGESEEARVAFGFLITLTGTAIYAMVYILNDHLMSSTSPFFESLKPLFGIPKRSPTVPFVAPVPRQQCFWVGLYSALLCLLLMLLISLPHLAHLALNSPGVILAYLLLVLSALGHNVAYFVLLERIGAVATGILQALRAVIVFALSHMFFCATDSAQCYSVVKGAATVVVVSGVVGFGWANDPMALEGLQRWIQGLLGGTMSKYAKVVDGGNVKNSDLDLSGKRRARLSGEEEWVAMTTPSRSEVSSVSGDGGSPSQISPSKGAEAARISLSWTTRKEAVWNEKKSRTRTSEEVLFDGWEDDERPPK
ncbi:hypothetical protein BJ742DRAFT_784079 [Cladochytrium replicatum]|nr:hypothetical protein BJ742DRAFT_784079 [Cladochytrium replicatum]